MAIVKHAPGPYKLAVTSGKKIGVRNSGGFLCFMTTPNHYTGQDERYIQETQEMNLTASLFSAAPDLLEALKALLDEQNGFPLYSRRDEWQKAVDMAEVAISKAESTPTQS